MTSNASISRRTVILGAFGAVAGGMSLAAGPLATPAPAHAGVNARLGGVEVAVTNPVSVEEYSRLMPAADDSRDDWTWIDGVHEEYRRAIAVFPLLLPVGYAFPAHSQTRDDIADAPMRWSVGAGGAEAYLFWQQATATSAVAAYNRGHREAAAARLNVLEAGYVSSIRSMYVDDPSREFIRAAVAPARSGNFGALRASEAGTFLRSASNRAIAAAVGDRF